jgi:hypothetical protein
MTAINSNGRNCTEMDKNNSVVFGYSSPLTGKAVSAGPNFDFLNSVLSCIKDVEFKYDIEKYLSGSTISKLGDLYDNVTEVDKENLDIAIDELTLKLIGPEVVLVSYGHVASQKYFRDLIHSSAINIIENQKDKSTGSYLKNIFVLIHLRDEFMSY